MSADEIVEKLDYIQQERRRVRHEDRRHGSIVVIVTVVVALIITVIIGVIGYMSLFGLSWVDATYNAVLVLTGIDEVTPSTTTAQKVFIMLYSFFSVILLLSLVSAGIQRIIDIYTYDD